MLAWAAFRVHAYGRRLWWTLLAIWGALPLSASTISWKSVWQRSDSLWNQCRTALTPWLAEASSAAASTVPMSRAAGEAAVIWIHTAAALPWVALLFGLAASLRDRRQEDAAQVDRLAWTPGTGRRWAAFACVAAVGVFLVALGEISASDVFAVRTYAEEIYLAEPAAVFDPFGAAAEHLGFPWSQHLLAVGGAAVLGSLAIGWATATGCRLEFAPAPLDLRRRSRILATLILTLTFGLFLVVPVMHLVQQAGIQVTPDPQRDRPLRIWQGTTVVVRILEQPWRLREEMLVSLVIATSVSVLAWLAAQTTLGLMRWRRWLSLPILGLVAIAVAIPGPLLGVLALQCRTGGGPWMQNLADQSLIFPIAASTLKSYPLALVVGILISSRIPQMLRELGRIEAVGWGARWWRLEIEPFWRWHLLTGVAIALGVLGDVSTTSLILPPGVDTLARRLLGMVHAGVDDAVAAATLGLMLMVGVLAAIAGRYSSRSISTLDS